MRKICSVLAAGVVLVAAGCEKKEDPTKRPGFVDTSTDPGKVMQTMDKLPKGKNATSLGTGGPGAPGTKP